jgi:predicted ester cyclase
MTDVEIGDVLGADAAGGAVPSQRAATPEAAAAAYFAAWNAHDAAAVVAAVTGSYVDPTLPAPISGDDLLAYVDGLCAAFPDLAFHAEPPLVDGTTVVARWRMSGTNDGAPLPGAPAPSGGRIDLPGIDVLSTRDGRVADVVGYFDQKAFVEQLGLQTILAPADTWPVSFGLASRVDVGHLTPPGAISFTWIDTTPDEVGELQRRTQEILTVLASDPAFIGFRGGSIGDRHATLTFWTSPEAAEAALARNRPHDDAMSRLWQDGLGHRGFTSIWQPYKVNTQFGACSECGRYLPVPLAETTAVCECGGGVAVTSYV